MSTDHQTDLRRLRERSCSEQTEIEDRVRDIADPLMGAVVSHHWLKGAFDEVCRRARQHAETLASVEAERDALRESLVLADAMANELRIAAMQAYISAKIDIQRLEALATAYAAARQRKPK